MHEHGPQCIDGPIPGTPGWWQELGRLGGTAAVAPPRKKKRRRSRHASDEGNSHIRMELVARVRREIAAGTYDTAAKWEEALDRLLDHLCPE